jgi:hypothetical protein
LKDTGHPLLAKEALDVLGLRPDATAVEIKEAYRDLVKVWHPDRFGSDDRLRKKADDKLQQINVAYRILQSGSGKNAAETARASGTARGNAPRSSTPRSAPVRRGARARSSRITGYGGWIYGSVGVLLIVWAGFVGVQRGLPRVSRTSGVSVQQVVDSSPQAAPIVQTPRGIVAGRNVQPQDAGGSNHSSSAQLQVRTLSEAETAQLESACSRLKEMQEPAAYQTCLKAQLDMITNAPGPPDLSTVSGADRESMKSACSEAKRLRGPDGYDRCLRAQMAELAAEPARPDLSTLNARDRNSIEAACRNAKYRDGPSAYDRCRDGFMKALTESR